MPEWSQRLAQGSIMANRFFQEQVPAGEWLEDPSVDYPQGDLDTDIASFMNSISPEECDLLFPEEQGVDMDSTDQVRNESWFSDFVSYEAHDSLMPDTLNNTESFQGEDCVYDGSEQPLAMGLPDESFPYSGNSAWEDPILYDSLYDLKSSMRPVVEAQAAADTSCLSKKEKKMEASIAIYMDRMQESLVPTVDAANTNTSSSSPYSSGSVSPGSSGMNSAATDNVPTPNSSGTTARGVELVLDLNMNTTSDLARKHKPRSQAQRDNYIKARKYGACEKHKKQHKRCNCMEVKANRLGELALDNTQAIQPQRPRPVQTHSLQPRRTHAVQSPVSSAAGVTSPKPQSTPVSCSDTGMPSTSHSPRLIDSTKPVRATSGQHGVITPSLTSTFSVHGTNRQARVQAGLQTQLAGSKRPVNTGQPGLQRAPPGKSHVPDYVNPRAVVAEQLPGHRPLWRPSTPVAVYSAMDYDYGAHTKPVQNQKVHIEQSQKQTTHASHRLQDTIVSGTLQIAWVECNTQRNSFGASQFVSQALKTWSRWTKAFSAFTSWTGANLGQGIIGCSKQYWSLQRA